MKDFFIASLHFWNLIFFLGEKEAAEEKSHWRVKVKPMYNDIFIKK